jgi:hypothetical protein
VHVAKHLATIPKTLLHVCASFVVFTSRKKAIPGAPKLFIPGAFWFAGDLHVGGNAYRWRIFQFAGDKKKLPLAHLVYAPGITLYPW